MVQLLNLELKQVNYYMAVAMKESKANESNSGISKNFVVKFLS